MVGNGERLTCDKLCPAVPLRIETHTFVIPCYLLPIEGADVVLGLDWLATLAKSQPILLSLTFLSFITISLSP